MASLNEFAYNILNIARGGLSSDDDRLNIRQIKHWVEYYRARVIVAGTDAGKDIDEQLVQDLGCCELKEVDKAECPEVLWGENIKYCEIPKLVDLPYNRSLLYVGLVDKVSPFILSSPNIVGFREHQRFAGDMRKAYMIGNKVYVTDPFNEDICYINIRGIFSNPLDVVNTDENGNCKSISDDDDYPMPPSWLPQVTREIMQYELQMTVRMPNDELNDSRETGIPTEQSAQTRR